MKYCIYLCGACVAFLLACAPKANQTQAKENRLVFSAAGEIAQLLPLVQANAIALSDALVSLEKLEAARKNWCSAPGKTSGLSRDLTAQEKLAFARGELSIRGLLGCSAWYAMTDRSPDVDFAYAQNVADSTLATGVHCVSVGFLQPYLMSTQLRCDTLSVVDLSFRTLRLHAILMPLLAAEKFIGIEKVVATFEKRAGVSLAELCGEYTVARCKIRFMAFAEKYRGRLQAELQLAPLESFIPRSSGEKTVAYLSNAIDPNFMTAEQLNRLRKNFSQAQEPLLAIYHQAESTNFGVYAFSQRGVQKICADKFVVSRAGRYSKDRCTYYPASSSIYTTYFDTIASNTEENLPCLF